MDGRELLFYPCREGVYITWTLSDDGVWLPWNQHPELPAFHPNIIWLDATLPKTELVPSRDPADAWKGEDATEENVVYWESYGPGVKAYMMHPEVWAALPDEYRLRYEPYEVRIAPPLPGEWVNLPS